MTQDILNEKGVKLTFMLSNWYSGATLFAVLLNNHREITCNGETFSFKPKNIDRYLCSCGKPLIECDFYKVAAGHMIDRKSGWWNKDFFVVLPQISKNITVDKWFKSIMHFYKLRDMCITFIPVFRKKTKIFLQNHIKFFIKSCELDGSSVYIDGTKSIRRAELFATFCNANFKIIHLIRDGRGFCYSYIKNKRLSQEKLPEAAKAWKEYIQLIDMFSVRYPEIQLLTIRYEDLCRDQHTVLSDVLKHLGLPFENNMKQSISKPYHMLGNVMRKNFNGKVNEDLSWKTKLKSNEIDKITALMDKDLRRFGYI